MNHIWKSYVNVFIVCSFFVCLLSMHQYVAFSKECNDYLCVSIVSKCILMESCKCDAKNITCSKDCFYCLGHLYSECCSCVEMCPKSNESKYNLSKESQIEDLAEPFPDLFSVLTEEKDGLLRWTSYSFQVSFISLDKELKVVSAKSDEVVGGSELEALNCTVAYMSQCMPWNKCKDSCSSMGASSYRWFHDGCCECVGPTCLNYGVNESRCLNCPPDKDQLTLEELNFISKGSANDLTEVSIPQEKPPKQKDEEEFAEEQKI